MNKKNEYEKKLQNRNSLSSVIDFCAKHGLEPTIPGGRAGGARQPCQDSMAQEHAADVENTFRQKCADG